MWCGLIDIRSEWRKTSSSSIHLLTLKVFKKIIMMMKVMIIITFTVKILISSKLLLFLFLFLFSPLPCLILVLASWLIVLSISFYPTFWLSRFFLLFSFSYYFHSSSSSSSNLRIHHIMIRVNEYKICANPHYHMLKC